MKASTIQKLITLLAGQLAMGQGYPQGYIAVHPGIVTVTSVYNTTATSFKTIFMNGTATSASTSKDSTKSSRNTNPRPTAVKTSLRPVTTTRLLDPSEMAPLKPTSTTKSRTRKPTAQFTTVCGDWGCAYAPVSSASIITNRSQVTTSFQWACPTCLANVGQQDNTPSKAQQVAVTRSNIAAFTGTPTGRITRCSFLDKDGKGQVTGTREACSTVWAVVEGSRTVFEVASTGAGK